MRRAAPILAILLALSIPALGAAPASAAEEGSPWWQLLSGSRPSNLRPAPDQAETQEVRTTKAKVGGDEILVAKLEVGGEVIGCLGSGSLAGIGANLLCLENTGFHYTAAETPAQLQTLLEAVPVYAEGDGVRVSGGSAGGAPFVVETPGRWVTEPLRVTPGTYESPEGPVTLGSASSEVTSEGSGILTITLTDLGTAAADASEVPLTIHDSLPSGAQAYDVRAIAGTAGEPGPVDCELASTEEAHLHLQGRRRRSRRRQASPL